jgi:hypothetical protein
MPSPPFITDDIPQFAHSTFPGFGLSVSSVSASTPWSGSIISTRCSRSLISSVVRSVTPSTDKDADAVVHPGALTYLNDSQQSFFDKYGDEIFYGLLIFPVFGSALAGMASYQLRQLCGRCPPTSIFVIRSAPTPRNPAPMRSSYRLRRRCKSTAAAGRARGDYDRLPALSAGPSRHLNKTAR